jgi:glutamate N-acetyltransferase/amino-acid N-acetyltransferase
MRKEARTPSGIEDMRDHTIAACSTNRRVKGPSYRCAGFRFAGIGCGIKESGKPDLALVASDGPARAAAVFTRNRLPAAPVILSRKTLATSGGKLRAAVINSGNANACTGRRGLADARAMQRQTAAALGLDAGEIAVASTGVIGEPLPMTAVSTGIESAAAGLRPTGFADFATAILTTDRGPKTARRQVSIGSGRATLIGCTKGAGMIAPNMATTLTFVFTDAGASAAQLERLLSGACAETFNAITVDGDTSTNDMILLVAGGASGRRPKGKAELAALGAALTDLLAELATAVMREGEGVHHVVRVEVTGARSVAAARQVARAIALSPLVKTAIAGGDPNWGRIAAAAGNAGVPLRPGRLALAIGDVPILEAGVATADWPSREADAAAVMQRSEYTIRLDLGAGDAAAHYLACDLSHEYVTINADYRT